MADVSYGVSVRVSKDKLFNSISASSITASMSQAGLVAQTITLSPSAVNISTASLSVAGLAVMQNLSTASASTALVGVDNSGQFVGFTTLRSGEAAVLRLTAGANYQVKGASGALLRVDILEG